MKIEDVGYYKLRNGGKQLVDMIPPRGIQPARLDFFIEVEE